MQDSRNRVLQITDSVSTRKYAVRLHPEDVSLPLNELLDRYLKNPPLERLRRESRITEESAQTLLSLQDLVYACTDEGQLRDVFPGVAFMQGSESIALEDKPSGELVRLGERDVMLIDLVVDRTNVGYDRNWTGFNNRRWSLSPNAYSGFVQSCLDEALGHSEAESVLELGSTESRLKLVEVLARKIWESEFENYSRFIGHRLVYKSGDETVRNIMEGCGGICSEKVQALKFLTDHYGIESELVLAGPNVPEPAPESKLRELLTTFDFRFAKRHMRYWQHTALLFSIDGVPVLVDNTNGNIPFLFVRDGAARNLLGYESKPSVPVRMTIKEEGFYYHQVSQDIPQDLLFAMEGWIPYIDLVQVFDNELGLYISEDFMVAPIVFRSDKTLDRLRREYLKVCQDAGLRCMVADDWELDSPLGEAFTESHPAVADKIMLARDHLVARYDECHGMGHEAGLVVIGLRN